MTAFFILITQATATEDAVKKSPISAIEVSDPAIPFKSHGDLFFSTWADDDTVFVSWGDGFGPEFREDEKLSHNGLMRLQGDFPDATPEIVQRFMPLSDDVNNSKPTSLLFLDGRLYVAIHSPLLTPVKGFIAWSEDYGETFQYDLSAARTSERNPNFICLMFINMGKAYELNRDGFVYALGSPGEINQTGKVYLARMPRNGLLDESTWTYFAGLDGEKNPEWTKAPEEARRLKGLSNQKSRDLFPNLLLSAAWHPGTGRYLAMTATNEEGSLYEAPNPWGPWRRVDKWFEKKDSPWRPAYMPGIFTKGMDADSFYFSASGRFDLEPGMGDPFYRFRLGKIVLKTDDKSGGN